MRTTATSPERASTTKSRWPADENAIAEGPSPHGLANAFAVVDGVDRNFLGAQVADVEQGIVGGDEAAHRIVAHQVRAAHIVGAGHNFGDGVRQRVRDKQFAAIGLERKLHRRAAHVEQGFQPIGRCGGSIGTGFVRQLDGHDLVAAGAGCERLGRVGQNDDIGGAGAAFKNGANLARGGVDDADGVSAAVGDDERLAVRRETRAAAGSSPTPICATSRRAFRSRTEMLFEPELAT